MFCIMNRCKVYCKVLTGHNNYISCDVAERERRTKAMWKKLHRYTAQYNTINCTDIQHNTVL
jgi:hypothetical protein